ncbi:MAG: hypothetical protein KBS81_11410 [Spirochaetales bacterium]|nr:hypothetical protein [Candidatus Physcosoma equi]
MVKKNSFRNAYSCSYEKNTIRKLSDLADRIEVAEEDLSKAIIKVKTMDGEETKAYAVRDEIIPAMQLLRVTVDEAETLVAAKYWPVPTYGELLFSVR